MEHLIESHLGGYYISDSPECPICEECGDSDWVVLSYEEGHLFENLVENYSIPYLTQDEMIREMENEGLSKSDIRLSIMYHYEDQKNEIDVLEARSIIDSEEKNKLYAVILATNQINLNILKNTNISKKEYPKMKGKKLTY